MGGMLMFDVGVVRGVESRRICEMRKACFWLVMLMSVIFDFEML